MSDLKNLRKLLKKLNSPEIIDGEEFDRGFDFVIEESDGRIELYDRNENYHYSYAEEIYYLMCEAAEEFGFDPPKSMEDKIHDEIEKAVKKDLGKSAWIEWEDNIRMSIWRS